MSNRLNQDREKNLQPKRIREAVRQLEARGYKIESQNETSLTFIKGGEKIKFYPYSGWATGKTITDGRGLNNLLKQL